MRNFVIQPVDENILFVSFQMKVEKVKEFEKESAGKLFADVREQIEKTVFPAYQRMIFYFEALEAKATTDDGVWKLPDGEAYYAYQLRSNTTSDFTPEEVHQLGLEEVNRIQSTMHSILDSLRLYR